ncbi:hypothetical protein GCM10007973_07350 [Polymorphobacter multimanifer]|uniref:Beta-lactamase regulating signal transducer with metallopeptidase domain n=1 Tax=Polymorphobacter multimanifer TaxID=1070431 RepID=A0A841L8C3_9SPHN|nr:M56 family metallopeptidase [Polymorphobacter multimanifer]MBB6228887.1 beta-lactamase regulating signal transducer with metallopeptidase domain [Polymorphobacter multimanifer]GGI72981.1 hypothetical protein GCM10007973_07350 [Polymorphobacter multimanifer]
MIDWLLETLIMTTLLMALVLLLRRPVARSFGAHAAYALWLLPAARAVLPVLPGWRPWLIPADASAIARPDALTIGLVSPEAVAALPPEAGTDWGLILLIGWIAGTLVFAGLQRIRYRRFIEATLAQAEPLTRIADIDVLMSPAVHGPMAAGLWQRRILLPTDFQSRYTPEERRLALLHEGAHHDRRDLWANALGLGVLALHWWNPVAHFAWKAFRADQELACDATVLAGADGSARAAYASAILKSATPRTPAAACALNHVSQLKERLGMMKPVFGPVRQLAGGLAVAGAIVLGLAATASGAQPAPPTPPESPRAPQPPAPPAPPEALLTPVIVTTTTTTAPGKPVRIVRTVVQPRDAEPLELDQQAIERDIEAALAEVDAANVEISRDGRQRRVVIHNVNGITDASFAIDAAAIAAEARATAARSIAQTRAEIAADSEMPQDIRDRVLASLDKAIRRMERRSMK